VAALADIPVGPGLAAALASLDLPSLTGSQCIDVVQACFRQDNHQRAALLAILAEVIHCGEADTTVAQQYPGEFAADEVRAALMLTRRAAENLCQLAADVLRRLPAVQAAFAAGLIDQPRVCVFSHWTCGLPAEHTDAIVAALLPRAPQLTTAQLIGEIQRHAIGLDPDWARRRYETALTRRRVAGTRNRDGTANHPDPLDIDCPTCTAKAGEPCKVRKRRGTYQSPEHFQSFQTAQPMHQKRIDKATDITYDWLPFMPGRVTGRAARLRILRRYAPDLLPEKSMTRHRRLGYTPTAHRRRMDLATRRQTKADRALLARLPEDTP
jgi:hypothetical protein